MPTTQVDLWRLLLVQEVFSVFLVPQVSGRMLNARGRTRPVLQVGAGRCHSNVLDAQILGRRRRSGGLGHLRLTRIVAAAAPRRPGLGRRLCSAPPEQA